MQCWLFKQIPLLVLTIILLYGDRELPFGSPTGWVSRHRRGLLFTIALCAAIGQFLLSYDEKRDSDAEAALAQERIAYLTKELSLVKKELSHANDALAEQTRSLGSVVFNVKASDEGKERFVRAFSVLKHLPKANASTTGFASLVLDDGVAVYWFEHGSETISGFRFFSNSDVNRVLRGIPVGQNFVGTNGAINLGHTSELAIAFDEVLFRRTPLNSTNALEAAYSRSVIFDEIAAILCYVYRAENIQFNAVTRGNPGHEKPDGSFTISFDYVVDPFAEKSIRRSVASTDWRTLSATFMRSLYDIPMSDLSQKVIGELRKLGIEPTINPSDIALLDKQRKSRQSQIVGRVFAPVTYRINEVPHIVGYEQRYLTKGRNTVEVRFKAINKPFMTLADVLRVAPAQALVGDELAFDVGEKSWYRVESYDGSNGVLRLIGKQKQETLTFDAIPLQERFTIRHNNATNLVVEACGQIGREYQHLQQESLANGMPIPPDAIVIRHESANGASSESEILLRGGIIQNGNQDRQNRRSE